MKKTLVGLATLAAVGGCNRGLLTNQSGSRRDAATEMTEAVNLCLPTSPPSCMDTCLQAGAILNRYCAVCHEKPAMLGVPPFGFVLDVNMMIASDWSLPQKLERFLVPGDPDDSGIYWRTVILQDMPPPQRSVDQPLYPRPNAAEGSVLQHWIADCLGDDPRGGAGTGGSVGTDAAAGTGGSGGTTGTDAGSTACMDASAGETPTSCGTSYPPSGFYGANLLLPGCTSFDSNVTTYEMAVDIADPLSLQVKWTLLSGQPWGIVLDSDWRFTTWTQSDAAAEQTFAPRFAGRNEANITFMGPGSARLDFFECGSTVPTRTEIISWF